jgi:glycine cleavage system pyridoxal-binding protein P
MKTRTSPLQVEFSQVDIDPSGGAVELGGDVAGLIVQYPNTEGHVQDNLERIIQQAHKQKV